MGNAQSGLYTVDLWGEDGITIYVSDDGDIETERCNIDGEENEWTRVIGRELYPCSLADAHCAIRDEYLSRNGGTR